MQIQVNMADPQTRGVDAEWVQAEVSAGLERFEDRITRVEVHIKDTNASKGGVDKQCTIEARLSGLAPMAVTTEAADIRTALSEAVSKLERKIHHDLDKRSARR
jgi:ribosome-associated translation inhibitor RaiA